MMDVEIDDQHPIEPEVRSGGLSGDGDVVEQAEAFAMIGKRMMARRPHDRKGIRDFAAQHRFQAGNHRARRQQGRLI